MTRKAEVGLQYDTAQAQKNAEGFIKLLEGTKKYVLALNDALIGSAKQTKEWQSKLSAAFETVRKADVDKRMATFRSEADKLGLSADKLAREMLHSVTSFDQLASVLGITENKLRRMLGVNEARFVAAMSSVGTSASEVADTLGKTVQQVEKLIPATTTLEGKYKGLSAGLALVSAKHDAEISQSHQKVDALLEQGHAITDLTGKIEALREQERTQAEPTKAFEFEAFDPTKAFVELDAMHEQERIKTEQQDAALKKLMTTMAQVGAYRDIEVSKLHQETDALIANEKAIRAKEEAEQQALQAQQAQKLAAQEAALKQLMVTMTQVGAYHDIEVSKLHQETDALIANEKAIRAKEEAEQQALQTQQAQKLAAQIARPSEMLFEPEQVTTLSRVEKAIGKIATAAKKLIPAWSAVKEETFDLNKALVGSSTQTEEWRAKLAVAFETIKSAAPETKLKTIGDEAHRLGVNQRLMAEELLRSGVSFTDLAAAMGKTEDQLRRFLGLSESRFAQAMNQAGVSVEQLATMMGKTTVEIQRLIDAQNQASSGADKAGSGFSALAKKIGLWAIGAASAFRAYMKVRRELEEGFRDVYQNTEEYKHLSAALEKFRNAIVLTLIPQQTLRNLMEDMASFLDNTSTGFMKMRAETDAWTGSINNATDALWALMNLSIAIQEQGGVQQIIGEGVIEYAKGPYGDTSRRGVAIGERFAELERERIEIQGKLTQATNDYNESFKVNIGLLDDSTKDLNEQKSAIDSLVDSMRDAREAFAEHEQAIREINDEYNTTLRTIAADWFAESKETWKDYFQDITDINAKYDAQVLKAQQDHQKALLRQVQQAQREIEQAIEQHNLQMKHMAQQYNLSMLQNERMYEAEREYLIAEGDTLAIDQLDKRYALEKEAAQENYELQRKQQEEMFQLQLKYMQEAAKIQAQELAQAIGEQMREIEEARRKELEEAEKAKQEKLAQAKGEAQDLVDEAGTAHTKQLQDEDEFYAKSKAQRAQFFVDQGLDWGMSLGEILAMAEELYGPDAALAELIRSTYIQTTKDNEDATAILKKYVEDAGKQMENATVSAFHAADDMASKVKESGDTWNDAMQGIKSNTDQTTLSMIALAKAAAAVKSALGATGSSGGYGGGSGSRPSQHGVDTVVSTPTTFKAGEGYSAERVIVTPLSSIGGSVSHSWDGGAIPVQGQGSMSGADMSSVAQKMTSDLLSQLTDMALTIRGQRG